MTAPEFDFKSYYYQFAKNIAAQAIDRFTGGPRIDAVVCQIIEDRRINARASKLPTTLYEYQVEIFDGLIRSLKSLRCSCRRSRDTRRRVPRDQSSYGLLSLSLRTPPCFIGSSISNSLSPQFWFSLTA